MVHQRHKGQHQRIASIECQSVRVGGVDKEAKEEMMHNENRIPQITDVVLNNATGTFALPAGFKANTQLKTVTVTNDGAAAINISQFQAWDPAGANKVTWTSNGTANILDDNLLTSDAVGQGASLVMTATAVSPGVYPKINTLSGVVLFANFTSSTGAMTMVFDDENDAEIFRLSLPAGQHIYRVSFDDSVAGLQSGVASPVDIPLVMTAGATQYDANWASAAGSPAYAAPTKLVPRDPKWDFYAHNAAGQRFVYQDVVQTPLTGSQRSIPIANLGIPMHQIQVFQPSA